MLAADSSINFGAIYENVVAQELSAQGRDLYYFNSKRQGEIDFVIEREGEVLPIEVKSGKDYNRHNALRNVLANKDYNIKEALVLQNDNLRVIDNRIYAPMYLCAFLCNEDSKPFIHKPDLSGLL